MSSASTAANRRIRLVQPAAAGRTVFQPATGKSVRWSTGRSRMTWCCVNHEALWLRRRRPSLPDVSRHLAELRSLLLAGEYERAQFFLDERLRDGGYDYEEVDPFQPAFDIRIDMPPGRVIRGYCRELDLTSGEVVVRWTSDAGVFTRALFVSRVDGVIVMRIKVDRGSFDATVSLAPHGWRSAMVFEGTSRPESIPRTETTFRRWTEGEIVGIDAQQVDGTTFGGILSVVLEGGSSTSTDGAISFKSATSATLVLKVHVDEPSESARRLFLESWAKRTIDYDEMLRRHRQEHQRLMSAFDFSIGDDPRRGWTPRTRRRPPIHRQWFRRAAGGIRSLRAHLERRARWMASQPPGRLERGLRAGLVVGLPQRRERSIDVLAGTPRGAA